MMPEKLTGIQMYIHCHKCMEEVARMPGASPKEYARTQTGVTPSGSLVVWCNRHDEAVCVFTNDTVQQWLLRLAGTSCDGEDHKEEPHGHA